MDMKTILIFAGVWLLGYVLGLVEASIKQKMREGKEEKEQAAIPEAVVREPLPAPVVPATPEAALSLFETPIGDLELSIDGERVAYQSALTPEQRQRIIGLVVKMRPWLDAKAASPKPAESVRPASAPAPAKPVPVKVPPTPASREIPTEEREYANLSMVQQIDHVLQKKLSGHPLQSKGIRLQESITGGVNFYIGVTRFEFIDQIPDPEIREIIQEAISEWENSATPGL